MHHSDFQSHQYLTDSIEQNESEAAWIRRYNIRIACQRKHQKQSFIDCILWILWILSIILLLGVINTPAIIHFFTLNF